MTDTTLYALPEQKLGQIPGSGGSARLQKMVGITRTKDIVMRSRRIPGPQAFQWGVATDCVPDAELESATDALVDELRTFSPLAQRTAHSCSTTPRIHHCRSPSSSKATAIHGCAARRIARREWRRFIPSGAPGLSGAEGCLRTVGAV